MRYRWRVRHILLLGFAQIACQWRMRDVILKIVHKLDVGCLKQIKKISNKV